jgi:L-ascorbate oxidase
MVCNDDTKANVCPANTTYCSCIHVLEVDLNDLVEVILVDEGFTYQTNHPLHLHGQSFALMGIDKVSKF